MLAGVWGADQVSPPSLLERAVLWRWFRRTRDAYRAAAAAAGDYTPLCDFPCLHDHGQAQPVEPTYYYQDSWAFQQIFGRRPDRHVDVGSHHKFIALLSLVVPTTTIDIRRQNVLLDSLDFQVGSILDMPYADGELLSVSSICVIEHIGLGRYGDPIDPAGTDKALAELKRVVAPGGDLYLSVPVDDEDKVYFNAHRARRDATWRGQFEPFEVVQARYIFGERFGPELRPGFGTACYHLRRPPAARNEGLR